MKDTKLKTLILVGGGHAHLYLIKRLMTERLNGYQTILISVGKKQYYSGMASAYIEDIYDEAAFSVDLKKLCGESGVLYKEDEVRLINPKNKTLVTSKGNSYTFDLLSLDTGSEIIGKQIPGALEFSHMVKPLSHLKTIKASFDRPDKQGNKVVIVGAGAAGVEMALAIRTLLVKARKPFDIAIVDSGNEIMKGYKQKVKTKVLKELKDADIDLIKNELVSEIKENQLIMASGRQIRYGFLMLAAGSVAHSLYKESAFEVDERGYMFVNTYLQNELYPSIFGVGDCITFKAYDYVNKVGVYAIKEAPILWENLKRMIENKDLKSYVPQKSYLSIVSLGNRRAVLSFRNLVLTGRLPWYIKDWIDRRFIQQYQR